MVKRTVKVISLLQPWAFLFASGAKGFETRCWQTTYRGELFIHASKKFSFNDLELCYEDPHFNKFIPDPTKLVTGAIIGKTNLTDIFRTEDVRDQISKQERAFGDYNDGRYAWKSEGALLLPNPIQVLGKLSIWEYQLEEEKEVHHG